MKAVLKHQYLSKLLALLNVCQLHVNKYYGLVDRGSLNCLVIVYPRHRYRLEIPGLLFASGNGVISLGA